MFGATVLGPVLTQVVANADVAGYDGTVCARSHVKSDIPLTRLYFSLDDMSKLRAELVHAPANARAEPRRLVCQTKAEPATAAQETERGAPESSSPVGLPYRSSCVSRLFRENFY